MGVEVQDPVSNEKESPFSTPATPLLPKWNQERETYHQRFIDVLCVALNTIATIVLVFLNKFTLQDPQFRQCQITIAAYHFLATFIVLLLATRRPWRLFKPIQLPVLDVLPLSIFFSSFLILNNLSLTFNPVGFYQLSKIMTTPTVLFINFALFGVRVSRSKLEGVLLSCVGVGLVSSLSFSENYMGIVIACAAFIVTACYQIWIGRKMRELECDAPQLLLNQAFSATLLLIPIALLVDVKPDLATLRVESTIYFLCGGIVASMLNLSQFLIIGRTSALTFNIVSNLKMVAILALGWYSEGKVFSARDVIGASLAISGAWYYAVQCSKK